MDMVFKIMNEGNAFFQHLKSVTRPIIEFHSFMAKPGIKTSMLLKNIAIAIIFYMPPWLPMCLKWLRC